MSLNRPINAPMLQIQAEKFARDCGDLEFKCTSSWIDRFKERYDIIF